MSNKPDKKEEEERIENLNKLVHRVQTSLEEGNPSAAKGAITRNWRDAVPSLPLRFTVVLVRANTADLKKLIQRNKKSKSSSPQLKIVKEKKSYFVRTSRGEKLTLGEMPYDDVQLLEEMGRDAKLFRPRLLEIYYNEQGKVRGVSIEMVRPDPEEERKKKDKRKMKNEDFPHTSVHLQEALDNIVAETDEDLDI